MSEVAQPGTVVHFVTNIGGGVWSVVHTLAQYHRPRWRVMVVGTYKGELNSTLAAEAKRDFDGSWLVKRPGYPGSFYLPPLSVRQALKKTGASNLPRPLVLHFHTGPFTSWAYSLPGKAAADLSIACFHGSRGNFDDVDRPLKLAMHRRGVRDLARRKFVFTAVSRRSALDCAEMYGCSPDQFEVIYNGADAGSTRSADQAHGQRPFHVGFVGTIMPPKGWRKVVAAAEILRKSHPDAICTIVGEGPEFGSLQQLAEQHSTWLRAPGFVADPASSILPEFDVLVLPSDYEGHPRVLIEALACGVPCLASDVGGNSETIRDGIEGFILRDATAGEIAARLREISETPGLWSSMSIHCRETQQARFTARRMADTWESLYLSSRTQT